MQLYNELKIRFEQPLWALNPELALFDTIIEYNPDLVKLIEGDVKVDLKLNNLGRKDTPTVEQILRAGIFKEIKKLDYRELELAMYENLTFKLFMKLDDRVPFSYSTLQKYISKISEENLRKIIIFVNSMAITEGKESVEKVSPDTTVVATNVHYPTNNSLVWDCIKTATRLLKQYKAEQTQKKIDEDQKRREKRLQDAKKLNYIINNEKTAKKQKTLFDSYLKIFGEVINEVALLIITENKKDKNLRKLSDLLPLMRKVKENAYRFQILGEKVENSDKIFSIYEKHTDIIVKGQRDYEFGHKVMITRGTSNFILDYEVYHGNPNDKLLYQGTIGNVIKNYTVIPNSASSDGGFASNENLEWSAKKGIVNTVFTKVTQSMKNIVESAEVETLLKKWRSGTEAVISNLKRGFGLQKVVWEGFERFSAKVAWSVLCYNLRVFSNLLI